MAESFRVLVVDIGSHVTRAGWSGDDAPNQTLPSPDGLLDDLDGPTAIETMQAVSTLMRFDWSAQRVVAVSHAGVSSLSLVTLFMHRLGVSAIHLVSQLEAGLAFCGRGAGIVVDCGKFSTCCGAVCWDAGGLLTWTLSSKAVNPPHKPQSRSNPRPPDQQQRSSCG
jgi:hypothetical protein